MFLFALIMLIGFFLMMAGLGGIAWGSKGLDAFICLAFGTGLFLFSLHTMIHA